MKIIIKLFLIAILVQAIACQGRRGNRRIARINEDLICLKNFQAAALARQNFYRNLTQNTPALVENSTLNDIAFNYASNVLAIRFVSPVHSNHSSFIGENLFFQIYSEKTNCSEFANLMVDTWYNNEKNFYDFNNPENNDINFVGFYTQLLWNSTTDVGCGIGYGQNPDDKQYYYYGVCNYSPEGNIAGEFGSCVNQPIPPPTLIAQKGGKNKGDKKDKKPKKAKINEDLICLKNFQAAAVTKINFYRAQYVNTMALIENNTLDNYAFDYASNYLSVQFSDVPYPNPDATFLGENFYSQIFANKTDCAAFAVSMVDSWYNESASYDYNNPEKNDIHSVAYFTQLIWQSTSEVGCGIGYGQNPSDNQYYYYGICFFSPQGNIENQFAQNINPKLMKASLRNRRLNQVNKKSSRRGSWA